LLAAITVSETLVREHPQVVAQELLERWPLLPARMNLDERSVGELQALKSFMLRWGVPAQRFSAGRLDRLSLAVTGSVSSPVPSSRRRGP
jgi:hypothetical protein